MKKEVMNYIAEKIFYIAFSLMPRSDIKVKLGVWFIETYGGDK